MLDGGYADFRSGPKKVIVIGGATDNLGIRHARQGRKQERKGHRYPAPSDAVRGLTARWGCPRPAFPPRSRR